MFTMELRTGALRRETISVELFPCLIPRKKNYLCGILRK
jgi:hypothetical protein